MLRAVVLATARMRGAAYRPRAGCPPAPLPPCQLRARGRRESILYDWSLNRLYRTARQRKKACDTALIDGHRSMIIGDLLFNGRFQ